MERSESVCLDRLIKYRLKLPRIEFMAGLP